MSTNIDNFIYSNSFNAETPFTRNYLSDDNTDKSFERIAKCLKGTDKFVVLAFSSYAFMYELFDKRDFKLSRFLQASDDIVTLMQQLCGSREPSFSCNKDKNSLKKYIYDNCNTIAIFENSYDIPKFLIDVYCNHQSFNYCGKHCQAKSVAFIKGACDLDKSYRLSACCNNLDSLKIDFLGFAKYVEENVSKIDFFLKKYIKYDFENPKIHRDFAAVCTAFAVFLEYLGLNISKCEDSVYEYFSHVDDSDFHEDLFEQFVYCIRTDAITSRNVLEEYKPNKINYCLSENKILFDNDNIYIYDECIKRYIVTKLPCTVRPCEIYDVLSIYGGATKVKLSVKIRENNSNRSVWYSIPRNIIESDGELPLFYTRNTTLSESNYSSIYLGKTDDRTSICIPYLHRALSNAHIGILGDSGMGKTNIELHIVQKLCKKGIPSIIVDAAGSFRIDLLPHQFVKDIQVKITPIAETGIPNPIRRKRLSDGNLEIIEKAAFRSSQILSAACGLGEKQKKILLHTIVKAFNIDTNKEIISINDIISLLEEDDDNASLIIRLYDIIDSGLISDTATLCWDKIISSGTTEVLLLDEIENDSLRCVAAELLIQDFWQYMQQYGREETPAALVIDEISMAPPKRTSALGQILSKGRKYGVMCIWNTQFLFDNFSDDAVKNMQQCATKLCFHISDDNETLKMSKRLSGNQKYVYKTLKSLEKGECVVSSRFIQGDFITNTCSVKINTHKL